MKKEVKIAGAGLSGLTAGINLLKAGYRVVVYEQREDVGQRLNNDFQGICNWMNDADVQDVLREMNIEIKFLLQPFREAVFFGPGLSDKRNPTSSQPIFYLIKRGNLENCIDYSLKEQFIKQGGEIRFNTRANLGDVDIIATGPKRAKLIALGYIFETDLPNIACGVLDNNIAPRAYAYLLTYNREGTLAIVLSEDFQNQEKYLEKAVEVFTEKLGLTMIKERKFGGIGDFFYPKTAIIDSKLYVGEAAGFQDYLAGFGMYYALRSGFLVAKSIVEKLDYDKLWKKEFNDFLKSGISNRFLFEFMGNKGYKIAMRLIERHRMDTLSLIRKGYTFDWRRKIVFPIAYLINKRRR